MNGVVRLALQRPYTFVVVAILILIFGSTAALRTPTDIFPNIKFRSSPWSSITPACRPTTCPGRIVTFYERALTTSVNDIEHIESQSIPGYGVIKIFFQPTVNINAALAQVGAMSQTVLKQMPPGITPPTDPELQRVERADPATRAVERHALANDAVRSGDELHPPATGFGRRRGHSVALWRQGAAGPGGSQSAGAAHLRHLRATTSSTRCRSRI